MVQRLSGYSIYKSALLAVLTAVCIGCQTTQELEAPLDGACRVGQFTLSADFDGARLGTCQAQADNTLQVLNSPENQPINHSPWYAFKVTGGRGELVVQIDYAIHEHRYWPKTSTDGAHWSRLPEDRVTVLPGSQSVRLRLAVDDLPLWVAGQELLTQQWYSNWLDTLSSMSGVTRRTVGQSVAGRKIELIETNPEASNTLILVGRQHPPEVTGAIGMRHFVDRLMQGHPTTCTVALLCAFYDQTNLIIVPLLNPDGVANGHWRHNLGGLDLNRDWGPFSQPEIQAMRTEIDHLVDNGHAIQLFLDFHSTQKNVFYTQSEDEESAHGAFATQWLALAETKGAYTFGQERRHNEGRPTAKNYMFSRFGIPSITYEVGDETDRGLIKQSAEIFADTMVTTLQSKPD